MREANPKPMSNLATFKGLRRVRVCREGSVLYGYQGRIVRRRKQDEGAWVRMERDLPDLCRGFPANDERFRDVLVYPQECEPAPVAQEQEQKQEA